jgi:hypothetical protein
MKPEEKPVAISLSSKDFFCSFVLKMVEKVLLRFLSLLDFRVERKIFLLHEDRQAILYNAINKDN